MKHSTKRPTKAEAERMRLLKEGVCIACHSAGWWGGGPPEVHHLLSGNKRRGHLFTVPLCRWHHRGDPPRGYTKRETADLLGPSLALTSKKFRDFFGTDDELLAKQNQLLGAL